MDCIENEHFFGVGGQLGSCLLTVGGETDTQTQTARQSQKPDKYKDLGRGTQTTDRQQGAGRIDPIYLTFRVTDQSLPMCTVRNCWCCEGCADTCQK